MGEQRCAFCNSSTDSLSFSEEIGEEELKFCKLDCLRSYLRRRKLMSYLP